MKTRSRTREPKSEKAPAQQRGGFHLASARALLPGRTENQPNALPSFAQRPAELRQEAGATPAWMNINFSELPLNSDLLPDNALLDLAIAGTRMALPRRATLETCFGVSLAGIAVYCNPATRKALERFNAEAAVYRGRILLRESTPSLFTLAHEITHILQFDATEAPPSEAISPATAAAESEAESLASRVERRADSRADEIPFAPLTAEAKLSGNVVALRSADRTRPATTNQPAIAAPATESGASPDRPASAPERQTVRSTESESRSPAGGEAAQTPGVDAEATGFGEMPTAPEPGVTAEQVAARAEQVAAAQTALDNAEASPALMDAFATAPPTIKAQVSGDLGNRFSAAMSRETQTIQENTPAVEAEMNGNTPVAAGTITSPDATTVELEPVPPEPTPDAETVVGASVQNEEDAERNTSLVGRIAAAGGNPAALERLRAQLEEQSLDNVQTTDPSIVTSPGEPPAVPLQGETDPQRYQNQLDEGSRQGRETLALQKEQALALPGVERVQLADVHESLPLGEVAAPVADDAASPEGAQQYLQLNMPAEVQTAFDDIAGPSMQQSQAEAQTQVQQAAQERDQQHQAEVQKAETETAKAQREADTAQRNQVTDARSQIETSRRETLDSQQAAVEQMETDAELKRDAERQEFDRQTEEKQGEIDGKYEEAEAEAEAKVREGEAEAEAERQRKEREAEDQSWWEAALDFITDLFDALVSFINKVFDAVRSAINGLLNVLRDAVMGLIDAIASALKGLIRAFGEILKGLVQTLLGDLFPELAAKLTAAIDSAVELATSAIDAVADTLKSAVNFIVETLRAGINALLNVFQGALNAALALARAALTGDWEAFFLQLFEAACRVAGIDPESIYAFIGRARETIDIIINDPGQFVSNIFDSVLGGFRLFGENFLTHLQRSVIEWLTGTLGSAGITLPERFDLMGVISLVAQILGLTWANLRQRIVRVVGERGVQIIEFVAGYVQTLIEGGWSALWERIQNDLASLRDMVLDQLKNFIVERIITAALTRLATMFNPVGALFNLILAAYQFYTFVRDQMERIARVVGVVAEMIGNIARGVLGPAMQAVESVLANLLTLALDLLARLLGLGNVGARVREILESVQAAIWGAIDRLINVVIGMFRGGGTQPAQTQAGESGQPEDEPFTLGQENHTLRARINQGRVSILMASNEFLELEGRINNIRIIYIGTADRPGEYFGSQLAQQLEQRLAAIEQKAIQTITQSNSATDPAQQITIVNAGLDQIETIFAPLGQPPFRVETERGFTRPTHRVTPASTDSFGRAVASVGDPISRASQGQGGAPSAAPAGWSILRGVPGFSYERGHLVAGSTPNSLGGPGNDVRNLTPISQATNTSMRVGPEKLARDAIYDNTVHPINILRYTVRCHYNPSNSGLESWLVNTFGASPGSADRLYALARVNDPMAVPTVHTALGGASFMNINLVQVNIYEIRKKLARYFLAERLTVSIQSLQGPTAIAPNHPIDNHQGVSLP